MVTPSKPGHSQVQDSAQALSLWLSTLRPRLAEQEFARLAAAASFATECYTQAPPLAEHARLQHALGTAEILDQMHMDTDCLVAALLHAVPDVWPDWSEALTDRFGSQVVALIEGFARMSHIQSLTDTEAASPGGKPHDRGLQLEALRKMLLAMVQDIRVVLIKLAERAHLLRILVHTPSPWQQQIARENQSIFVPLANRLGIWQLKWELEDLSLRILQPQVYKDIARMLDERRVDREQYIAEVVVQLQQVLADAGIRAEVTGRPKHISSIVKKMQSKHLAFDQLYDVRAVRILVQDVKDCYSALGLVHHVWQPIPGEFDDYIARPKSNDYRSLHTAVSGPRGLALEVQIRTYEMHHHSELGVAAHWRYKEGRPSDSQFDEKIAWLRQILSWKDEVAEQGDMLEQFNSALFQDRVYVLTPLGKVIDLPAGATPIDFAYALHTDLGHRIKGAKLNGQMVPLHTKLQNGQRVEILTAKQGAPSRDWLNPNLGYLQTTSARAKVRHWFKYQHADNHVALGRARLDKELQRAGASHLSLDKIAHSLHFNKLEDCLAAIGRGDISEHQMALSIQAAMPPIAPSAPPAVKRSSAPAVPSGGISIAGIGQVHTTLAKCCKPVAPEPIVAYLTRQHQVTVHRQRCNFITRLPEARHARLLAAEWGTAQGSVSEVDIVVEANDRQGLLRDISDLLAREKINTTQVNTLSRQQKALMRFSIEITDLTQLQHVLMRLQQIPGVVSASRQTPV